MAVVLADSLSRTFAILGASNAPRAGELLSSALAVPEEAIQRAAAQAILNRRAVQGQLDLLDQLPRLPASITELVRHSESACEAALKQALLQGLTPMRLSALRAVRLAEQYVQVPQLIELLCRPGLPELAEVAETFRSLVYRLYDRWQSRLDQPAEAAAAQPHRKLVLNALEVAANRLDQLGQFEEVLEAVLILAEPGHSAVKRVLWNGPVETRERAGQMLLESRHPGILRFLGESLSQTYPHPKVFEALQSRHDPEFVTAILRRISRRISAQTLQNLRQVTQLPWLEPPLELLDAIPSGLQPVLVELLVATRVPATDKAAVQEWLLRHGSPEGKQAATERMALVDESVMQDVLRDSLESDDAAVQAWATHQLRQHSVPEAFSLLVERLDSPLPAVQQAAREELAGFDVERVLSMAEELSADDAQRAGQLLLKVDLEAIPKLRRALAHPARQKRIKTARVIWHLDLHPRFIEAFVAMTVDVDPLVRRTGAEILATLPCPESYRALQLLCDDLHPRVRELARQTIEAWELASEGLGVPQPRSSRKG